MRKIQAYYWIGVAMLAGILVAGIAGRWPLPLLAPLFFGVSALLFAIWARENARGRPRRV